MPVCRDLREARANLPERDVSDIASDILKPVRELDYVSRFVGSRRGRRPTEGQRDPG